MSKEQIKLKSYVELRKELENEYNELYADVEIAYETNTVCDEHTYAKFGVLKKVVKRLKEIENG